MIVAVRLNDRVTAPFLIDTGATDVLIPQAVAEQLGVQIGRDTRRVRYQTANGIVENPVVTLDAVDLGGARVEGVPASVSPSLGVGLLGLSFFNHFTYEIDAAQGVVRLKPNDLAEQGLIRGGRSEAQWRAEFGSLQGRRRAVEEALGDTQASHGRERARLTSLLSDLDRDLELLTAEADQASVPSPWRQ
jgi:clan AA aspartic protease (TIGR02281 family)